MISVLVVENEKPIADAFCEQLNRLVPEIVIHAVCSNVKDAVTFINTKKPDLVFLDIELDNGELSFEILKNTTSINFEIIFTTAFNQYAVQAIKLSALDYLLKPVLDDDLLDAIQRFRSKKNVDQLPSQLKTLFNNLNQGAAMHQVALPTMQGFDFVSIETIIYCEGTSSQTIVYLSDKPNGIVISKTLKECESLFPSGNFFRIHKSHLVNMNHIRRYAKGKDGQVLMSNGQTLSVSRIYKDQFLTRFAR